MCVKMEGGFIHSHFEEAEVGVEAHSSGGGGLARYTQGPPVSPCSKWGSWWCLQSQPCGQEDGRVKPILGYRV